jgi:hypothetical protein
VNIYYSSPGDLEVLIMIRNLIAAHRNGKKCVLQACSGLNVS